MTFPAFIARIIGLYRGQNRTGDKYLADMADALDRHANRLRDEVDEPPTQFTIEPHGNDRFGAVVYDSTGKEHLFQSRENAAEFIAEQLDPDHD